MLTQNEITSLSLSPTKKDFVQIWNELLEVAGKLSERWDPTSTNESDPGIVILKALTGIADKLNYNIDKNTLEAFMPTAAQEDSMRKLCDMLGYNIKYYQSAETYVAIKYYNSEPSQEELDALSATNATAGLVIPKFTVITNGDQDINYFTLENCIISTERPNSDKVPCMEGQIVKCESINDNNVITVNQISENNRFYLPETQIAENGIFIYNVFDTKVLGGSALADGTRWDKVDNLNVQARNTRVYKFGFDSYEGRPYIEFPEDYSELFNDGIFIYYARTSGASGNISAKTLTRLELPTGEGWSNISAESFTVENTFSATTGANIETIKQAYNNFKKTIGTFETLVTCRDYMNKIYMMSDELGKPYVSNILVTDIRNDLNRAITICSCDDAGIFYKETSLVANIQQIGETKKERSSITTETGYVLVEELENYSHEVPYTEVDRTKSAPIKTDEQVSDMIVKSDDTQITSTVIVDVNKPFYSEQGAVVTVGTNTRATHWFLNGKEGETTKRLPIFADGQADSFAPSDFDEAADGIVMDAYENGNPSTCWLINQNGTIFTTYLPIIRVPSSTRTIVNEQTKTITNEVTETIKEQRTLKEQNTITNVITDTITNEIDTEYAIDHFDLVLYPFKSYNQIKNNVKDIRKVYDNSFTYSPGLFTNLKEMLNADSTKTIAHNIISPRTAVEKTETDAIGDVVSINNYLRLNATIATNSKITVEEGSIIIDKIKIALANAFNMRELDFGEEIPFDSIVETIENADSRIRVASLNEPALYTTFSVLDDIDVYGNAMLKEYAVASDWLSVSDADTISRFTYKNKEGKLINTFDVEEARKIYNKLAVRNVLAGRVPLFNYNNTFKTSFSEGAYQVTTDPSTKKPADFPENLIPREDNPFTIWVNDGITYTGQFVNGKAQYTETYTPEAYATNVITTVDNNAITDIVTNCEILSKDKDGTVSDVTLASGEFIKFRAPNFTTIKTYPAYVNYHLALNTEILSEPISAEATSLFDLLDADRRDWKPDNTDIRWQKVLDYFGTVDAQRGTKYKYSVPLKQTISKYTAASATSEDLCESTDNTSGQHVRDETTGKCKYCGKTIFSPIQKGPITVDVNNTQEEDSIEKLFALLEKSGCLKLANKNFKARLEWSDAHGDTIPKDSTGPNLDIILNLSNPFITDSSMLSNIAETLDARLNELVGQVTSDGNPVLPTECAWTIYFDFECVPFEPASFAEWERFVRASNKKELFGFTPAFDGNTIFWRTYGEGYSIGKYILQSSEKLLKFDSSYFGVLPSSRLRGIYLVENLGKDAQPAVIKNNVEYMLRANEYLYIEYTPSSTTEDGTTQELAAVTEIFGPGTIIRPSGFEADSGLVDSTVYASLGNSPHKTVTFETANSTNVRIDMHRFGANEQVEIRDFAKVELSKESFKANSNSTIYYYKNFNDCDELENADNPIRTYTLKDGEYIFYTDQSKAELAYFTTGTEVTLTGNIVLEKFDIVDLATIFDSGLTAIPWKYINFSGNETITFQEYQYRTLGPGDTLKNITLMENSEGLTSQWQYCNNVEYSLAGSNESIPLPAVNTYTDRVELSKGNGWQVCSTLELDVTNNYAQTLRSTDQVRTSIDLISTSPSGGGKSDPMTIEPEDLMHPLSFKTNLSCQTSSGQLNIDNIYANPNKLKGFELKIFAIEEPVIVKTAPGKVIPYQADNITDITNWRGEPLVVKSSSELWNSVSLDKIKVKTDKVEYDNALRLPISILPNTYGVFCIYLKEDSKDAKTWIEVLPGTVHSDNYSDITLLNIPKEDITWETFDVGTNKADKLFLKPGINCIRVNKTSRIFIKTSNVSQGTLFFDELKLVNCKQIEYSDLSGGNEKITKTTQGLNLDQLGYLNTNIGLTDTDVLDNEMLNSIKTDHIAKALNTLDKEDKIAEQSFSQVYNEMLEIEPKLQLLLSTTEQAKDEIENLLTKYSDNNTLLKLFQKYSDLSAELLRERDLLEAMDNNKNIENLGQELVVLLESFSATELSQQQLLVDLEALKAKAIADADKFSNDDILKDFEAVGPTSSSHPQLTEELKAVSLAEIEARYNEQLITLSNNLEKIADFEERENLTLILNNLQSASSANTRTVLLTEVRQLVERIDQDTINKLLDTVYKEALSADYLSLASSLSELREHLSTDQFGSLVSEIELAANEGADAQLINLVTELKVLVETAKTPAASDSIISLVDTMSNNVQTKITNPSASTPTAATIIDQAEIIRSKVSVEYLAQLQSLLTSISTILDTIAQDSKKWTDAISQLKVNEDGQISEILNKLKAIATERQTAISEMPDDYNSPAFEFKDKAILSVWPKYMKNDLISGVEYLYNLINNVNSTYFTIPSEFNLRPVLIKIANVSAFRSLFEQAKSLAQTDNQNSARKDLINQLSKLIPTSTDLSDAMAEITLEENSSARNAIIRDIINKLRIETDVAERQHLFKKLRAELNSIIQIDNKIVHVTASLLCPTILSHEYSLPTAMYESGVKIEEFYEKLTELLNTLRNNLLKATTSAALTNELKLSKEKLSLINTGTDGKLQEYLLNNQNSQNFKIWVALIDEENYKENSVLPNNYQDKLFELKDAVNLQNDITNIRTAKLFDVLNKNTYAKKHYDSVNNVYLWLDQEGNEVEEDLDGILLDQYGNKIDLKRDEKGNWLDSNNVKISVKDANGNWLTVTDTPIVIKNDDLKNILENLLESVKKLDKAKELTADFKAAYAILKLEEQLLADIRAIDRNQDFYYTAPIDTSLAIEFNESDPKLNTLMNPIINYDINNINNNFVISKLDIDYLDKGIQIARSSRLN